MASGMWLRRALPRAVIFLLAGLLAAAIVSPAGAQSSSRPFGWTGVAGAFGAGMSLNSEPKLLPIDEFIRGEFPQADSEWLGSGIARARAAGLYPGSSGTGGPGLLCDFGFPCSNFSDALGGAEFPPQYPLVADAQHPSVPEARSADGLAYAEANLDGVFSKASGTDNGASGGVFAVLVPVISIGSAEATTRQSFNGEGVLVVRGRGFASDITLPGGVVHIGSVEALSVSRADGENPGTTAASLVVSGATVGGMPATVGSDGITVDEDGGGAAEVAAANAALAQFEETFNARIRTVEPTVTEDGLGSSGFVGGLVIEMDVPASNPTGTDLPVIPFPPEAPFPGNPNAFFVTYKVSMTLAQATSRAHANNASFGSGVDVFVPPVGTQPDPVAGPPQPPLDVGPPPSVGGGVPGGGGVAPDPAAPGPVVDPGGTAAPPVTPVDESALANFLSTLGIELEWANLYPLVVLWALIMFVPFRLLRFVERRTRPAPVPPSP